MKIGILSTFPLRECGIATFSQDVLSGILLNDSTIEFVICAISDKHYSYGPEVVQQVDQFDLRSYRDAAVFFNNSAVDVVLVQHEFGIFGGFNGAFILEFLRNLKRPVVLALHTVPMHPRSKRRKSRLALMAKMFSLVDTVIVTIPSAVTFFKQAGLSSNLVRKIKVIPHGAPIVSKQLLEQRAAIRHRLQLKSAAFAVLTFGLITPKKGIHFAIRAMREVRKHHPDCIYLIAGRMHPSKSDSYYETLERYVKLHDLERNVRFISHYLTNDEVQELLVATDVYLVPYLTREQVSSGTLAYAVAAGKPIIATRFAYASDVLADDRGLLIDFASTPQIAVALTKLIEQPALRKRLGIKAAAYGRSFAWKKVGAQYLDSLRRITR